MFNLAQVLVQETPQLIMKINSFRPWLVIKPPKGSFMSQDDMMQMAKCKDLFDFGVAIFDLMIGKKQEQGQTTKVNQETEIAESPTGTP